MDAVIRTDIESWLALARRHADEIDPVLNLQERTDQGVVRSKGLQHLLSARPLTRESDLQRRRSCATTRRGRKVGTPDQSADRQ
jgi:hypothetical protein